MRVWRNVLIVVVVLVGLFYVADWAAVSVVQGKAADRAQASEGLDHKPKVSIDHFPSPFLTQVLFGKLKHVTVTADDINAAGGGQSVRIATFSADLYGVKFSDGYKRAVADHASGEAFVDYADLSKAAPLHVTVSSASPAPDGTARVKLTATVPGLGMKVSVLSRVKAQGNSISLHAESVPKELSALGLEDSVRRQIDFAAHLEHLPSHIELTKVTSTSEGISVEAGGTDVELAN
ncbi:MAG: DUF2993 domain-containing protein [Streptomyces sp.]|nr:DUF2993 domain-containing protein [Streptomyces sp.]